MNTDLKPKSKYTALNTRSPMINNVAHDFDIYVRLAGDKFLKICAKGVGFDPERLRQYQSSELKYFYVPRTQIENIFKEFHLVPEIINNPSCNLELVAKALDILATALIDLYCSHSVDEFRTQCVKTLSQQISQIVLSSPETVNHMIKNLSNSEYFIQRTLQTAILAVHIFEIDPKKPAHISSSMVFEAALLMDIGLGIMNQLPYSLKQELSQINNEAYQVHPLLGMDYASQNGYKNRYILEAIEQHHECGDGRGFPLKLVHNQICYLANILSVADVLSLSFCSSRELKNEGFTQAIEAIQESERLHRPHYAKLLTCLKGIGF